MTWRLLFLTPALVFAQSEPAPLMHLKVPMRDGVRLCTNVFRPASPARAPVLLNRTPYGKASELAGGIRYFVDHGYAVVVQDVRGRYDSGGVFRTIVQETPDGEDTISWIVKQPWSNGQVGMYGSSYSGMTQWRAAISGHPALKVIAPGVSGWDEYLDRYYSPGGAFKLGHRLFWIAENLHLPSHLVPDFQRLVEHVPLRTADRLATGRTVEDFQAVLDHPSYDDYWRSLSTRQLIDRIKVPALIFTGWYDNYAESDLAVFRSLRDRGRPARIVIGPYGHNMSLTMPDEDFGPDSRPAVSQIQVAWFDMWLKNGSPTARTLARWYTTGANVWREEESWPPEEMTPRAYYLDDVGKLSPVPSRKSHSDRFTYDPRHPVPTRGGSVCCNFKVFPWGPMDQRPLGDRADVLVFQSAPLDNDLDVTGAVQAVLYVSTSAPDTDFTAKLVDLYPDGRRRLLCDGILRLRYREGLEHPKFVKAGEVVKAAIAVGVTSHVFLTGHRVRLEISSSNFPRFDRNPNTGRPIADETHWRTAEQSVWHGTGRASHLLLPVVPHGTAK